MNPAPAAVPSAARATGALLLARATAWALLLAGWIGLGALSLALGSSMAAGFGLIAFWLLALGAAASLPSASTLPMHWRAAALVSTAALTALAVACSTRGGQLFALLPALLGWALLTALASGVVRGLRHSRTGPPAPPLAAALLGAAVAGVALGDLADLQTLSARLALFAGAAAAVLLALQLRVAPVRSTQGCRAGLFDCSLPAWPGGAWRDALAWPTLLAGLAMLPMMAGLPLMVAWCRAVPVAAEVLLLLHLAAMFLPAWLWRGPLARASSAPGAAGLAGLSAACALLLVSGTALLLLAPAPWDWLGLAACHGAAWSLAWGGLLWAPARRGSAGSSPLAAALGYALLTLCYGALVQAAGASGAALAHAALGVAALAACAWTWARAAPHGEAAATAVAAAADLTPLAADASHNVRTPAIGAVER